MRLTVHIHVSSTTDKYSCYYNYSLSYSANRGVMRGLLVFIGLLLVVTFVENISGLLETTSVGEVIELTSPYEENLVQCISENNGVFYNIYPNTNSSKIKFTGSYDVCSFQINNIQFTDSGEWKIITIRNSTVESNDNYETVEWTKSTNQSSFLIEVTDKQKVLPASQIYGEDGNYATLYFEKGFDDVTQLYIAHFKQNKYIKYVLGKNGNGTSAGLELYGQHGLRIPINNEWSGTWDLVEESGEYKKITGRFSIHSSHKNELKIKYLKWYLGEVNKQIRWDPYLNYHYFEVERPDGEIISLKNTQSVYAVRVVSDKHAGIWKARYISESSMEPIEHVVNVTVVDPRAINVTVTITDDNAIHMLCKADVAAGKFCKFISPNGTVIHALPGIGNKKYEFFGFGFQNEEKEDSKIKLNECGLTILNPSSDDYGLWKCIYSENIKFSNIISAYVSTDNLREKNIRPSRVEDIYVKRGDEFSIKCSIHESLDYCWIRSPNGTNYSVQKSTNIHTPNTLPYFGEGLLVGACGATIENANDADAGDWSCRLGVTGGGEKESTVSVIVTDSYVTPIRKTINLAYDEAKLVVKLLPSTDVTIRYCRWIRPDGKGFYQENSRRYFHVQNDSTCSLFLNDWKIEDVGTWSCNVRLNTGFDEELHTTIELFYETANVASNMSMNIIVISLVGTTILVACTLGYIFHKKRMTHPANPPPYFNELDLSKHIPIAVTEKTIR